MTTDQALEHLNSIYKDVETVEYDVFVARDGDNFELFQLEDGRLEHRITLTFILSDGRWWGDDYNQIYGQEGW